MPRKRPPSRIELGVTGLKSYAGRIDEEWHPRLRGTKAAKIYEEMSDNSPVVGAVLYAIETFMRRVEWQVVPADKSAAALKEARFLEECIDDMDSSWEEFISEVLSMLIYGYSLFEIVLKIRGGEVQDPRRRSKFSDGRFGWRKFAPRAQTTIDEWDLDDEQNVLGVYQVDEGRDRIYIPSGRLLHFRTRSRKNNPEGRSLLRNLYRPWHFTKRLEEIEAIGMSRDLNGMPVVEVPAQIMASSASDAQRSIRTAMEKLVSQLHRDEREGVVFPAERDTEDKPTGYKLKLLNAGGSSRIPADPVIRRHENRMLMALLAEFLMLGTEKTGSFALASTKTSAFAMTLAAYMDIIAATFNRVAVQRLYEINAVPVELRAKLVPGDIEQPDLNELGSFMQRLVQAGLVRPTDEMEIELKKLANMPLDGEIIEPPEPEMPDSSEDPEDEPMPGDRSGEQVDGEFAKKPQNPTKVKQ